MSGKKKRKTGSGGKAAAGRPSGTASSDPPATGGAGDAADARQVRDLDPAQVLDQRVADRLEPEDVDDLRDAIEENGQTVPILVRPHPSKADRYLLIYGRRRLEAIRQSDKVATVRALIASMDDSAALRAQISENMARRDLSYIEKALLARELVETGFGNQSQVADVLTVVKSSISMAIAIADMIGPDLIRAIGPAHGIGRPRWEAVGKAIEEGRQDPAQLERIAHEVHDRALVAATTTAPMSDPHTASVAAFEAVERALAAPVNPVEPTRPTRPKPRPLRVAGRKCGTVRRTPGGLAITLRTGAFADWMEAEAQTIVEELHARWTGRAAD